MSNHKDDKPVTLNQLGVTLEKFISPIYKRLDHLEKDVGEIKKTQAKQGDDLNKLKTDFDTMSRIQLRMENKLGDNIQALYDKGSLHDDKLKEHNKRITKLEKTI